MAIALSRPWYDIPDDDGDNDEVCEYGGDGEFGRIFSHFRLADTIVKLPVQVYVPIVGYIMDLWFLRLDDKCLYLIIYATLNWKQGEWSRRIGKCLLILC